MTFSSSQRQAIITGASSGIGRETALAFAKAGINVALVSRSSERLNSVVKAAQSVGVKAKAYPIDLSNLEAIPLKIEEIIQDFGQIDCLINSAGMGYTQALRETPLFQWQQVLNLNLTSVFQCVQGVLPSMRRNSRGTIVNVASIAAYHAFPEWGAYSVSKAGLVTFSKILAAEERSHGIRVIVISPGAVNTSIWDAETVEVNFERSQMLAPDVVAQSILQAILLPDEAVIEEMTIMPRMGIL